MLESTHRTITSLVGREIRNTTGRRDLTFRGSVYADYHRKETHPFHPDIELNHHHDIEINMIRIKKLIFYAKEEYEEENIDDATFDYCNALHFLCDSVIPPLDYDDFDHDDQKYIEELFDEVEIDSLWNSNINVKISESLIEEIIEQFCEVSFLFQEKMKEFDENGNEEIMNNIEEMMKFVLLIGFVLAKFVFYS